MWRSNTGFTVCHVYGDENNESSKLFWSIRKDKVVMINNSTPINLNGKFQWLSLTRKSNFVGKGIAKVSSAQQNKVNEKIEILSNKFKN